MDHLGNSKLTHWVPETSEVSFRPVTNEPLNSVPMMVAADNDSDVAKTIGHAIASTDTGLARCKLQNKRLTIFSSMLTTAIQQYEQLGNKLVAFKTKTDDLQHDLHTLSMARLKNATRCLGQLKEVGDQHYHKSVQLSAHMLELQNSQKTMLSKSSNLRQDIETSVSEHDSAQDLCQEQYTRLQNMLMALKEATTTNQQMKEELRLREESNDQLDSQQKILQNEVKQLQDAAVRANQLLTTSQSQIFKAESTKKSLDAQLQNCSQECCQAGWIPILLAVCQYSQEHDDNTNENGDLMGLMNQIANRSLNSPEDEKNAISNLQTLMKISSDHITAKTNSFDRLIENVQRQVQSKSDDQDERQKALSNEINLVENQLQEIDAEAQLRNTLATTEQEIEACSSLVNTIQELQKVEEEVVSLESSIETISGQLVELKQQESTHNECVEIQNQLSYAQKQLSIAEEGASQVLELQAASADMLKQIDSLQENIDQIQKAIELFQTEEVEADEPKTRRSSSRRSKSKRQRSGEPAYEIPSHQIHKLEEHLGRLTTQLTKQNTSKNQNIQQINSCGLEQAEIEQAIIETQTRLKEATDQLGIESHQLNDAQVNKIEKIYQSEVKKADSASKSMIEMNNKMEAEIEKITSMLSLPTIPSVVDPNMDYLSMLNQLEIDAGEISAIAAQLETSSNSMDLLRSEVNNALEKIHQAI